MMTAPEPDEPVVAGAEAPVVMVVVSDAAALRRVAGTLAYLSTRKYRVYAAVQDDPPGAAHLGRIDRSYPGLTVGQLPRPSSDEWVTFSALVRPALARLQARPLTPLRSRLIARLARLERAIPPAKEAVELLAQQRPHTVIVTRLHGAGARHVDYLRAARALGIRSVYLPLESNDLGAGDVGHEVPDCVAVWNRQQRRQAIGFGVPARQTAVIGAHVPTDVLHARRQRTREEYCHALGLRADAALVVVVPPAGTRELQRQWIEQWNNARGQHSDAALRQGGLVVFLRGDDSARSGAPAQWDVNVIDERTGGYNALRDLDEALGHCQAVVTADLDVAVEGIARGRPVIAVADGASPGLMAFVASQRRSYEWPRQAGSLSEQMQQLAAALAGGSVEALNAARGAVRVHGVALEPAFLLASRLIREIPPPPAPAAVGPADERLARRLASISSTWFAPGSVARPASEQKLLALVVPSASVPHWVPLFQALVDCGHRVVVLSPSSPTTGQAASTFGMHGVMPGGTVPPVHGVRRSLGRQLAGIDQVSPALSSSASPVVTRWRGRLASMSSTAWGGAIEQFGAGSRATRLVKSLAATIDGTLPPSPSALRAIDRDQPDGVIALPSLEPRDAIESWTDVADVVRAARRRGIPVASGVPTGRAIDDTLAQGTLRPRGLNQTIAETMAQEVESWLSSQPRRQARPRPLGSIIAVSAAGMLAGTILGARGWRALFARARHDVRTGLRAGDRSSGAPRP